MSALQRALFRYSAKHNLRSRWHCRNVSSKPPVQKPPHATTEVLEAAKEGPIDIPIPIWYKRLGPVTDFFSWFHRTQTQRPHTVQFVSSSIVYLCGDLLAQELGGELYDGKRTLRMLTIGAVASIPGYKW